MYSFFSAALYAKPYANVTITVAATGQVMVYLNIEMQIQQQDYKDKRLPLITDQIKDIWLSYTNLQGRLVQTYKNPHGLVFTYDSNLADDGNIYEQAIGTITDQNLRTKVIDAQRTFRKHLNLVRAAFYKDTRYDASSDLELSSNAYAGPNRVMYFEVRKLLAAIGIELPNIDWPSSRKYKALAITLAVAGGLAFAYYMSPKLVACSVEGLGTVVKKTGEYAGAAVKTTGSAIGTGIQKTGQYLQPKTIPNSPATPEVAPAATPAPVAPSTGGWMSSIKSYWPFGASSPAEQSVAPAVSLTDEQASHIYGVPMTPLSPGE